jgi:ssDNA-binding Zn-finger/Zn-ribbon topoisomerase 1
LIFILSFPSDSLIIFAFPHSHTFFIWISQFPNSRWLSKPLVGVWRRRTTDEKRELEKKGEMQNSKKNENRQNVK